MSFGAEKKIFEAMTSRSVELLPSNTVEDLASVLRGWIAPNSSAARSIQRFEEEFATILGARGCVSFGAGRVALAAILDAIGIRAGDEIIVPGYTCVAVPNPVLFLGARPVYADIERETLNVSARTIEPLISSRTRGIIVQHTFGFPALMREIISLAQKKSLVVIEDCTHAFGATVGGSQVGTLGHASFFSLEQTKMCSAGAGGIACAADSQLLSGIRKFQQDSVFPGAGEVRRMMAYIAYTILLRDPRWSSKIPNAGYYLNRLGWMAGPETTDAEMHCERPENFHTRLSAAQARVAYSQVSRIKRNVGIRRELAAIYDSEFHASRVETFAEPAGASAAYVRYPIRVKNKAGLAADLKKQNIQLGLWFTAPVHPVQVPQDRAGYTAGSCPEAELAVSHVANLPCHPRMTVADARRVARAVLESPNV